MEGGGGEEGEGTSDCGRDWRKESKAISDQKKHMTMSRYTSSDTSLLSCIIYIVCSLLVHTMLTMYNSPISPML